MDRKGGGGSKTRTYAILVGASQSDRSQHCTSFGILAAWVALVSCDASARYETAAAEAPPPSGSSEAQKTDVDQLVGTYAHVGGQAERDAVLAAIEDVVSDMNVIVRGIARSRLQASNPVPKTISIGRDGETIIVAFDQREHTVPLDGSIIQVVGVTGSTLDYRITVSEGQLKQHFAGSKGTRVNTMQRRGDDRLKVSVKVSSDSLPTPLEYSLTLERVD